MSNGSATTEASIAEMIIWAEITSRSPTRQAACDSMRRLSRRKARRALLFGVEHGHRHPAGGRWLGEEAAAAGGEAPCRFVSRTQPFDEIELFERGLEAAGTVEAQRLLVRGDPSGNHVRFCLEADKLVDPHALGASIDGDRVELSRRDAVARGHARRMPDDDRGAIDFVHALEAACEVHGVAERRVVQPRRRPDIADDRGAGLDADADAQLVAETGRQRDPVDGGGDGKRRAAGVQRLLGAPQNAMTASPMNLSMVPFSLAIAV